MVSREAAFLYNNLVLVGIAFSVLWGTLFPILSGVGARARRSRSVRRSSITVNIPLGLLLLGADRYRTADRVAQGVVSNLRRQFAAPVTAGCSSVPRCSSLGMRDLYALMAYTLAGFVVGNDRRRSSRRGIARPPAHARRSRCRSRSCASSRRNRRRYGGYIVHVGIVVLFAAFAGLAFKRETRGDAAARRIGRRIGARIAGRIRSRARASRSTTAEPPGHRGHARGPARRQAAAGSSPARSASTWTALGRPTVRALDRSRHPQRRARGSVRRAGVARERDRSAVFRIYASTRSCGGCGIGGMILVLSAG